MVYGYTPIDPIVVLSGTTLAIWYLQKSPMKLIGFMPTALSVWFFVPIITNLTLWQTVPLLLSARMLLKGKLRLPHKTAPIILLLIMFFLISIAVAAVAGSDRMRLIIRVVYYIGILATLTFAYEMGRRQGTYEILLKGLVIMGLVYSAYGAYQILAFYAGLPVRGIVYDASGEGIIVSVGGFPRVNSFANEPKRLGYILFISAMATVFLARTRLARKALKLRWAASGIIAISIMTFAGSYFFAILIFSIGAFLIYPSRALAYAFGALSVGFCVSILVPELGILDAIQSIYDSRAAEFETGLDGSVVYRQEFFAVDYLLNNPISALAGVGVGQYYSVLNSVYGDGAGYNVNGGLAPLNSLFLELVFDLGMPTALLIYSGLVFLALKLRRANESFLCLSLIFLIAQSLTIINFHYIVLFAGMALGRLTLRLEKPFLEHRPGI